MADILTKIVAKKRLEVQERCEATPIQVLKEVIRDQPKPRGFVEVLRNRMGNKQAAIIAEIKKASPSKGVIRENFDPEEIARVYELAGATCISVLTDESFFQGADEYLQKVKKCTSLPVLRKDFIIDLYQVYEARAIGSDCILLIASILDIESLHTLYELALAMGLDVLVEVHDKQELDAALTLSPKLIGINNRDLKTFNVDLNTTLDLLRDIPAEVLVVTESGISAREDIDRMLSSGVYGFLVGEAFMKAPDPGKALKLLFN